MLWLVCMCPCTAQKGVIAKMGPNEKRIGPSARTSLLRLSSPALG